jgi:hypothetical protein
MLIHQILISPQIPKHKVNIAEKTNNIHNSYCIQKLAYFLKQFLFIILEFIFWVTGNINLLEKIELIVDIEKIWVCLAILKFFIHLSDFFIFVLILVKYFFRFRQSRSWRTNSSWNDSFSLATLLISRTKIDWVDRLSNKFFRGCSFISLCFTYSLIRVLLI